MEKTHTKKKNVKIGSGQSVTVADLPDTEALIKELMDRYALEERLPGDIDTKQMMAAWGCTKRTAVDRLDAQLDLERHTVKNTSSHKAIIIWRKKQD